MRGTPRVSAIPASQNTAPVAEFRCLFTHDTRKKQKKWQDGYLKFHSFNSRVIVYDASRFTVGDTYYKDSNELQEGDELMLDKGVMVEVAEPIGVTQTDLTPLFERKTKESPQRDNAARFQRPLPRPTIPASNPLRAASQLRHKSLNALLGTPRGPMGKAAPIRSPFEERMEKENQNFEERAAKRQKTAHTVQAQQVPSRVAPIETAPKKAPSLSARPPHTNSPGINPRPQVVPPGATIISLSSQPEADNIPSDVTLPHTPSRSDPVALPPITAFVPARKGPSPQQKAARLTPKLPKGKVPVPHVKAQQTPRPDRVPSSPPVSAANRIANVDFAIQPASDSMRESSPVPSPPQPLQVIEKRKTKSLKLSTGAKRGMLLCQSAPTRRRISPNEPKGPHRDRIVVQGATVKAGRPGRDVSTTLGPSLETGESARRPESAPVDILDDLELAHGFMDQQLLVSPSPPNLHHSPTASKSPIIPKPSTTKQPPTKKSSKSAKRASEPSAEDPVPKLKRPKATQAKEDAAKPPVRKKKVEKPNPPVNSRSPSPAPLPHASEATSRDGSIVPSNRAIDRPRNASTSASSSRLAALSTGGFNKKRKGASACSTASEDLAPPPPQRSTTVTLPPHPLRSTKNGPLMSTTELSALLQSGPKSMPLEDDPIEDSTQGDTNISPSKRSSGFKRSRSENDAPIPSTSEEWEQRNMPKHQGTSKPAPASGSGNTKPKAGGLAALVQRTDPRRKFQRAQSLSVDAGKANESAEAPEIKTPPVDNDVGPWSSEAFDLFDWRPPGKEWRADGPKMRLVDIDEEEDRGVGLLVDGR
ncbi:uncharacterized protein N0V89_003698 [Didymosphaeria variabile]|uniref:5'-3' DNA helicase ZGRF1-like N-terminal domain-containing protein n=1 Tax=Didymosphaeria variabile TaxID=1932322 RepID=A0A9W8XN41_9PLEO|nr:uncharacterized protein N0V89_003698 [Didymosphaeria variabile]KAJ4355678.1 hypothetical protein N0V89_003698 [Didymosphaeria variabile]